MNSDNRPDAMGVGAPGEKKPYHAPELTEHGNLDDITGGLGFVQDSPAAVRAVITIIIEPRE